MFIINCPNKNCPSGKGKRGSWGQNRYLQLTLFSFLKSNKNTLKESQKEALIWFCYPYHNWMYKVARHIIFWYLFNFNSHQDIDVRMGKNIWRIWIWFTFLKSHTEPGMEIIMQIKLLNSEMLILNKTFHAEF